MLVGSGCEDGHALVARHGVVGGGAHCAHLFVGGTGMASGAEHEGGRALQRGEIGPEFAVHGVHLDHDVRGLGGRDPGRTAERRQDAHDPSQPAELLPDLLRTGL